MCSRRDELLYLLLLPIDVSDSEGLENRKHMREIDRLRRESETISRLLMQASLVNVRTQIEQVKSHLSEAESFLES